MRTRPATSRNDALVGFPEKSRPAASIACASTMDIGAPETEREIEITPLEEPVPEPAPAEQPVEEPVPA